MQRTAPILVTLITIIAVAACGGSSHTATVIHTVTRGPGPTASASTAGTPSTTGAATTGTSSTTTSTTTTSSPSAHAAGCRASGLTLTYLGGQGATGHGLLGFRLRNSGSSSCTTGGYPGVLFLTSSGAALATHPRHTTTDFFGTTTLRELTLAPGATASFRLGVDHVSSSPSGAGCVTAAAVQIIAPNDTATIKVAIPGGAYECGGTVTVSPLQAGDGAYHGT